ncbi:hypothetical protein LSH36_892g00016 [Paralvinella palmiformis]|uniref:Carbohydrate sulfotransferase n=1 Tax=Paralvinella palmiformis TaxID=53620 RepID=A0AAD9IZG8_9ANNE|nr:hypothetical protein LSH36_892g00016 [Paralvinella palmiformis]
MRLCHIKKLFCLCVIILAALSICHIPEQCFNYLYVVDETAVNNRVHPPTPMTSQNDSYRTRNRRLWNMTSQRGDGRYAERHFVNKGNRSKTSRRRWKREKGHRRVKARTIRLCTQSERVHHVREYCKTIQRTKPPHPNTLSDPYHRLIYCPIPKVASISFEFLFKRAAERRLGKKIRGWIHNADVFNANNLSYFSHLTRTEIERRIREYTKFVVVRHPFARLYSTYKDMVYKLALWRRRILAATRPGFNFSDSEYVRGEIVPDFHEFLAWSSTRPRFDRHWDIYQTQCHPCSVDWDLIFRTETIRDESRLILNLFNGDVRTVPRLRAAERTTPPGKDSLLKYRIPQFANLPKRHLDRLLAIYGTDMEMFGYHWNEKTHTASCYIMTTAGDRCC